MQSDEPNKGLDLVNVYSRDKLMENLNVLNESSNSLKNFTLEEAIAYEIYTRNGPVQDELSTALPLTIIYSLILFTGVIGNLATCIVIVRNKYMHNTVNYYLFSLACSDLLLLVLGLPQEIYMLWQRYPYIFGEQFCILRAFTSEMSTNASILTITAFTIERYLAICHPLKTHTMSQLSRVIKIILIIWFISAICSIPTAAQLGILLQMSNITGELLPQTAQCVVKHAVNNLFEISTVCFFILPMAVISVLYVLIGIALRRSSSINNANTANNQQFLNNNNQSDIDLHQQQNHHQEQQQQNQHHLNHDQHEHQQQNCKNSFSQLNNLNESMIKYKQTVNDNQTKIERCSLLRDRATNNDEKNVFTFDEKYTIYLNGNNNQENQVEKKTNTNQEINQQPSKNFLFPPKNLTFKKPDLNKSLRLTPSFHNLSIASDIQNSNLNSPSSNLNQQRSPPIKSPMYRPEIIINNYTFSNVPSVSNSIHHHRNQSTSRRSVIKMLVAVVVSFFICWSPFHAQRIMASHITYDSPQLLILIYRIITYVSAITYYLTATINPILYQLMSLKFRLAFRETFGFWAPFLRPTNVQTNHNFTAAVTSFHEIASNHQATSIVSNNLQSNAENVSDNLPVASNSNEDTYLNLNASNHTTCNENINQINQIQPTNKLTYLNNEIRNLLNLNVNKNSFELNVNSSISNNQVNYVKLSLGFLNQSVNLPTDQPPSLFLTSINKVPLKLFNLSNKISPLHMKKPAYNRCNTLGKMSSFLSEFYDDNLKLGKYLAFVQTLIQNLSNLHEINNLSLAESTAVNPMISSFNDFVHPQTSTIFV